MHNSGKVFFAGVGDHQTPCPGAIQIWKLPFEKASELQAHSKPVTRIRTTSNNTHLFSVGQDGLLCIFDIKDRDPKSQESAQLQLKYSEEILTEKFQLESLKADVENLESKFKSSEEANNEVDIQINVKKQMDTISERKNELDH